MNDDKRTGPRSTERAIECAKNGRQMDARVYRRDPTPASYVIRHRGMRDARAPAATTPIPRYVGASTIVVKSIGTGSSLKQRKKNRERKYGKA